MKLTCPYCNGDLVTGEARIHGTFGGFLLYGLSYENLYFKTHTGEEIKILGSTEVAPSLLCPECEVVILNKEVIEPKRREIIIDFLTICSSKELLESLKNANPDSDIYKELEATWNLHYTPRDNDFVASFNERELRDLAGMNELIVSGSWEKAEILAGNILSKKVTRNDGGIM